MPTRTRGTTESLPHNIQLDRRTVTAMIHIYCEDAHGSARGRLCRSCDGLRAYADVRLEKCPFGSEKTTCRECPIHCYRPAERALMKTVMRFAGPRMLWRHPWLALRHLWLERKGPPPWPPKKRGVRHVSDPDPEGADVCLTPRRAK